MYWDVETPIYKAGIITTRARYRYLVLFRGIDTWSRHMSPLSALDLGFSKFSKLSDFIQPLLFKVFKILYEIFQLVAIKNYSVATLTMCLIDYRYLYNTVSLWWNRCGPWCRYQYLKSGVNYWYDKLVCTKEPFIDKCTLH